MALGKLLVRQQTKKHFSIEWNPTRYPFECCLMWEACNQFVLHNTLNSWYRLIINSAPWFFIDFKMLHHTSRWFLFNSARQSVMNKNILIIWLSYHEIWNDSSFKKKIWTECCSVYYKYSAPHFFTWLQFKIRKKICRSLIYCFCKFIHNITTV